MRSHFLQQGVLPSGELVGVALREMYEFLGFAELVHVASGFGLASFLGVSFFSH